MFSARGGFESTFVLVPITATGGTVSTFTSNGVTYKVHTFYLYGYTGGFSVTNTGNSGVIKYLISGAGGAGARTNIFTAGTYAVGGGGGGGRVVTGNLTVTVGDYIISVGLGGVCNTGVTPTNGGVSSIVKSSDSINIVAAGGITAGANDGGNSTYLGGFGSGSGSTVGAGGGGGAGGAGNNATAGYGAAGGNGITSDINGTAVSYGGGGGGAGSISGSGNGATTNADGGPGTVTFGGGGSATGVIVGNKSGGAGGNGVVIIQYPIT
jgi:hypothetical protein